MKCERFIFRGNMSILLIKVKITSSATAFSARFPHRSLLHYAYGPLFQENNSDNNRSPLGV